MIFCYESESVKSKQLSKDSLTAIYVDYQLIYPRVTSVDALKQSTGICAHLITFSSRKYIVLK